MAPSSHLSDRSPAGRHALLRYVVAWLAIGGLVAGLVVVLLHDSPDVQLPPVQQTELVSAAARARCVLLRGPQRAGVLPRVEGRAARPLRAGAYRKPQATASLIGAMRKGVIVIAYRPDVGRSAVAQLEALQRSVPQGTIVVPEGAMPFTVAVTGWRRLLGCPRLDGRVYDAVRLFRGRYVGQGPDVGR